MEYFIKSNKEVSVPANSWLEASMGESALGEQTSKMAISTSWAGKYWDISGIAEADRDAIAHFGFKVLDPDPLDDPPSSDDGKIWLYIDYVRATATKAVKVAMTDGVVKLYPSRVHLGFRDGCRPQYDTAAQIKITSGEIEIDGIRAILSSDLTVTWSDLDAGSEAVSTWYYLYLLKPGRDGLAPKAKISVTAPSNRYHPSHSNWKCVGSFYNNSSGDIDEFYYTNDGWTEFTYNKEDLTKGIATSRTPVTLSVPPSASKARLALISSGSPTAIKDCWLYNVSSGGDWIAKVRTRVDGSIYVRESMVTEVSLRNAQTVWYAVESSNAQLTISTIGYWEDL